MKSGIAVAAIILAIWGATYCISRGIAAWRQPDYRTRNDRVAAQRILRTDPPAVDTEWGSDSNDLLTCLQILHASQTEPRKEKPQP